MQNQISIDEISDKIQLLKNAAQELAGVGEEFPAVYRNASRILASVKMLELNVSDLAETGDGLPLKRL
jgi:hypothetical protein